MEIKRIEHDYSVTGQIAESDLVAIAEAGFKTVICNRPDTEINTDLHAQFMEAEAGRLGLTFVFNPISHLGLTMENLDAQARAIADFDGPVLAYCRSGMRSTVCWSFINVTKLPVEEIISTAAGAGYNLEKMRPQFEAMAAQG